MKQEISDKIVAWLEQQYPAAECSLRYDGDPWKLLIMSILSAQCTDARVNMASDVLFAKFPTPRALAEGDVKDIEPCIRSCGLYHCKAESIKKTSEALCEKFGGIVPREMDDLMKLPGVGRKIANLIRGDIFGLPAVVCDTHCIRLAGRLGYTDEDNKNPCRTESALLGMIPPEKQSDFCHRLVIFGREWCTARAPKCEYCPLAEICRHKQKELLLTRGIPE